MALIDRESLLEKFQFRIEPFGVEGATIKKCVEMARDIIMDEPVVKDINVPSWIPVTERLPEDSRGVILCTRSRIVGVGFYDKNTRNWVQYYSGGGICVEVTHWMPLPEAPKEVE